MAIKPAETRLQLPIAPANWSAIKANVPGIADAAKGAQRTTVQTATPKSASIEILDQRANHKDSMRILQEHGLRPVTPPEILIILDRDSELKEQLKGKWFWLYGKGTKDKGYYTIQSDGSIKEGRPKDTEKTVFIIEGKQPLSIEVASDRGAAMDDQRFEIGADADPSGVAPVVVGIPEDTPINSLCVDARRQL